MRTGTMMLGAALTGAAVAFAIAASLGLPRSAAAARETAGGDAPPTGTARRTAAAVPAFDPAPLFSRLDAIERVLAEVVARAALPRPETGAPGSDEPPGVRPEPRLEPPQPDQHERLAALTQQIQHLQAAVEALVAAARSAPSPAVAPLTADAVLEALERIECARLEPLADEALLFEAEQCSARIDLHGARRRLEVLLARSLPIERRARATIQLAIVHRQFRSERALAKSAELLHTVWEDAAVDDKTRLEAAQQLVWTSEAQQDPEQARRWADAVLRERGTVDGTPVPAVRTTGENGSTRDGRDAETDDRAP